MTHFLLCLGILSISAVIGLVVWAVFNEPPFDTAGFDEGGEP